MTMKTLALLPLAFGSLAAPALAQAGWLQHNPATHPSQRVMHGMVFDTVAQKVLLFAGSDGPGSQRYNDTWEWDGMVWTRRTPAVSPPPRTGPGMAYDSVRGRAVVFGGITGPSIPLSDTWEWDGANWSQRASAHAPSPRCCSAMAYDSGRGRTVLFGGGYGQLDDTWEWDGLDWTRRTPANSPAGSDAATMAYDSGRGVSVLFLPTLSGGTLVGAQTWEWNGIDWTQRTPLATPSPRRLCGMAYDALRRRTVLFGGHHDPSSTFLDDTWEWDGTNWRQLALAPHPSGRGQSALAYDSVRNRTVLFGGALYWGNHEASDTWDYGGGTPAEYEPFGQGCAGHFGVPGLAAVNGLPILGTTLRLAVTNLPPDHFTTLWLGFSDSAWAHGALPYDLGALGMTYCTLYTSGDFVTALLNWGGTAYWSLQIPNTAGLLGMRFYTQAGTIDRVNPFGMIVSNAGAARIGDS